MKWWEIDRDNRSLLSKIICIWDSPLIASWISFIGLSLASWLELATSRNFSEWHCKCGGNDSSCEGGSSGEADIKCEWARIICIIDDDFVLTSLESDDFSSLPLSINAELTVSHTPVEYYSSDSLGCIDFNCAFSSLGKWPSVIRISLVFLWVRNILRARDIFRLAVVENIWMALPPAIFTLALNIVPRIVQASISCWTVWPTVEEAWVFVIALAVHALRQGVCSCKSGDSSGYKLFHFCFKLILYGCYEEWILITL